MKGSNTGKNLIALLAAELFLATLCAYGQVVNGSLVGTVTDTSGAVVPKAAVTITNEGTGVNRGVETNSSGYYSVPALPPATYRVTVSVKGFTTAVRTGITLSATNTVRVDVTLEPGSVTQTITVSAAEAPALQTETAHTGRTLNATEVEELPLSQGHNFQNLTNLLPGAGVAVRYHSTFFNPQNSMASVVNGNSSLYNGLSIQGINDNERSTLLQVYIPAMEAIQEVNITASNYDPAQGSALGAVTNVILKSGSNQFHGEAYEFYTGNALDSRKFFQIGPNGTPFNFPHGVDNYYGGNLGGPIQKEKTFFFVNYLEHQVHTGETYRVGVPTAALRNGDFSDPALPNIYNPATGDMADCLGGGNASLCGTGRQQFTGNVILNPDPVALKLLAHVPLPNINQNLPGIQKYQSNYITSTLFVQNTPDVDMKIDRYQGGNDHISGRFSYANPSLNQPGLFGDYGGPLPGGGINGGVEGKGSQHTYSTGINWVHTFSPTLLSEGRIGVSRWSNTAFGTGYGQNLSAQAGIPGANLGPSTSGIVAISGAGFSSPMVGIFSSLPWVRAGTNIEYVANFTKIHGNHTIQAGFDFIRVRDDLLLVNQATGAFNFAAGTTALNGGPDANFANNFASFLLGVPSSINRGFANIFPAYRQNQIFPYIGDKWQVNPKLTLNLGLRWEYYGPPTPHFAGGFSNYNPTTNNLELAGIGSVPRNLGLVNNYHNFGPRVGVAYRISPHSVVRSGFGISHLTFPVDTWAYNYPLEPSQQFTSLSSFGPALLSGSNPSTFEKGFPALPPYVLPSSGLIPATGDLLDQSYYSLNTQWRNPYLMAWNLAYERELPKGWVFDIAYVGNRGVRTPVVLNINAATSYGSGSAGQPEFATFGRTAETDEYFGGFRSAYDSLQVKLDHKISQNLIVTTSYTYGKAVGYESNAGEYVNSLFDYVNLRKNYAATDFNQTHIFNQSIVWNLPFGKGQPFVNTGTGAKLLGGWEFVGVWEVTTGFPLDFSGCDCPAFNTPGSSGFPNITGPFTKLHGINNNPWFDTSVFSEPAAGKQGNLGPYVYAGPNYFNLDASLFRKIRLSERFNLEFRSEWLHATNTPQFGSPDTSLGDAGFGLVTGVSGPGGARVIDLGAKLTF